MNCDAVLIDGTHFKLFPSTEPSSCLSHKNQLFPSIVTFTPKRPQTLIFLTPIKIKLATAMTQPPQLIYFCLKMEPAAIPPSTGD